MRAPELYSVLKITLQQIINDDYNLILTPEMLRHQKIMQQDNQLFEFVRRLSRSEDKHIEAIVFVECKGYKSRQKELERILDRGFQINGIRYSLSEKSASMSRTSMVSFVKSSIVDRLEEKITNGAQVEETVLAKYLAYRGLALSSSFSLGDYKPYVIIVDDFKKVIPNQNIRCVVDEEKSFTNKEGELITYKEKTVVDATHDITIEQFDGFGIHAKRVSEKIKEIIGIRSNPTTFMWRNAFFKGLTSEVDFVEYCSSRGIFEITDIFGVDHSIYAIDVIANTSMYKGFPYYRKYDDYRDWENYLDNCDKHGYSWRIAQWNYSFEDEPAYTKNNYQNLQCLQLPYEEFRKLADYSKEWAEEIIENTNKGYPISTYAFLGLMEDNLKPTSAYMHALLKNPEMMKDPMTRRFLSRLMEKNIDMMKCGRLYHKGSFRYSIPDIIAFLEYITGQEVKGVLEADEFYSNNADGPMEGEHAIFRNPHISSRENVKLKGSTHPKLIKYAGHLENICMLNGKSVVMETLSGSDHDGDTLFVCTEKIITESIDSSMTIVMDIDDKITAIKEPVTHESIVKNTIMSFTSMVGEFSNYATCYHNKVARTEEEKKVYEDRIDLLSVLTGKSIDYAKTGVLWYAPKSLTRWAKPFPYFMRYIGPYYARMKRLSHAPSNMNRLAKELEQWDRQLTYRRYDTDFNYKIMIDYSIPWNAETYFEVEELYKEFTVEFKEMKKQQRLRYYNPEYYNYFSGFERRVIENTDVDWNAFFEKYKKKARTICKDQKELANYAVEVCYHKASNEKNFAWIVAEEGILENIKPVEILLPRYDVNGEFEYLGKKYTLVPFTYNKHKLKNSGLAEVEVVSENEEGEFLD